MTEHTLPPHPSPFIGRESELGEVTERLRNPDCRLLTIIGPGGVGKTRLAVEAAAQEKARYQDGVIFIDLQPVEGSNFITALADALPLTLSGGKPPRQQLIDYLHEKEILLVLDNFEHLTKQSVFLGELLSRSSSLKLVVTSREALNLQSEWLYPLSGLSTPPDNPQGDLKRYGAMQLFLEHARRRNPDFSLEEDGNGAARICRVVEGLPLALKLAASWTRTLDTDEIAAEIERNLPFLSHPVRDMPERHHSIQAAFNQTWKQLGEEERRTFQQLSIFKGRFHREAAQEVAGASLDSLSTLVDKSMLRREERYHVHELLRQFGEKKLHTSPTETEQVRQRFTAYYINFLHQRLEDINSFSQQQAAAEIAGEWENIRAAWMDAVKDCSLENIRKAASTFFLFCQIQSRFLEGAEALREAVDCIKNCQGSKDRDLTLAALLNHEGWLRIRVGEFDRARDILDKSCTLYQKYDASPPPYMGTDSSVPLGITAIIQGNPEKAEALCQSALQDAETRDDIQNQAFAHYGLAAACISLGRYPTAYQHAEQACSLARKAGNRFFLAYPMIEWGNAARAMNKLEEAEEFYREGYEIKQSFDDPEGMAVALSHLGEISLQKKEYRKAQAHLQESLELYREINDPGGLAHSLKGLGQVAYAAQDISAACQYFLEALHISLEIQFWPLAFSIVVDTAPVLRSLGNLTLAVTLLTLAENHPSSRHETRQQARKLLEEYRGEMAADAYRTAVQDADALELDRALKKLKEAEPELAAGYEGEITQNSNKQPLIEPLTNRELDVLQLIAEGHTNEEISAELVLALGTVKWYASQIYGKLGVSNRTEAAHRARELGLLK